MKIYTRTGDKGKTSIIGGKKVSKSDLRIHAYGDLDELNSHIGLLVIHIKDTEITQQLNIIQNLIFEIGNELASTEVMNKLKPEDTTMLEKWMDAMSDTLPPLQSFIIPGGTIGAAHSHICRTIARRAERNITGLASFVDIDPEILKWINRLSDYFFVLSRYINHSENREDIIWSSRT